MRKKDELKMTALKYINKDETLSRLRHIGNSEIFDILIELNSSIKGISEENIRKNREKYGKNQITHGRKKTLLKKIVEAFVNPFTAILFCLGLISAVTDIMIPIYNEASEEISIVTVLIISIMVMISGLLRFIQESRSGNVVEKLLKMITTTTTVERLEFGKEEIPLEDVIVGDIIHLSAGDMIPSDLRLIESKDLFVSQSSLTGESEPIEKQPKLKESLIDSIFEYDNLLFMGSNIISGTAIAVVVNVGDETIFGHTASNITEKAVTTSFEKGVNSISWVLIRFMLIMVPIVFFINGFTKGNWTEALLFGVSIAVGLTPEMLPMIVTTSLAKGAVAMSKKKTIIKNLNSIQNFGAMDILCTDKTGTITQDKVVLEYHMDIHGNENKRVLRHAFLNSWYQTGLKNLMDLSIIECTKEEYQKLGFNEVINKYKKIDEIPFDFSRRRMTVVVEDINGKKQMITKGAVEEMLSVCKYVEYSENIVELSDKLKEEILKTVEKYNFDGLRVLAVAHKTNPSPIDSFGINDESDMVFIGYLAFLDPPKLTASTTIKALNEYGVTTKILTGDNDKVTISICKKIGIDVEKIIKGSDLEEISDSELSIIVEEVNVFVKLSPEQKSRIVRILRDNGHVVGFMGDGINDAAAMKTSDVGISVDTAVDIAKESADIILLEKDLIVLEDGIIEGRKTYANMIKYIKMTASSNFGNMFSVLVASAFIPFLPMLSIQLILLNLIYDLSCSAIPWDNVDEEFLKIPRKWDSSSMGRFMLWIGPISSIFDITTYAVLYFLICPVFVTSGVLFNNIPDSNIAMKSLYIALFQTGWFVESMWTQTLVIHMIRTPKIPFLQSRASAILTFLTCGGIAFLSFLPYTKFGLKIGLTKLPMIFWPFLIITVLLYMILITVVKKKYIKCYGELL